MLYTNQLLCGIILQVSDPNSLRLGLFDVGIDLNGKNAGFWPSVYWKLNDD